MNRKTIQLLLWPVIIILAWLVYRSPISLKEFQEESNYRKSAVIQDLKDIRTAQIAFKDKYRVYANDFNSLLSFVKNDSLTVVKAVGETPDSLTEDQALKQGIISRDTIFVPVFQTIFNTDYLANRDNRFPFDLDMLSKVPFSNETYNIESGNIEKGKVIVQVFEVSTTFGTFLNGLEATNKGIDLNKFIKVGSMSDASINGNWGE
ncbi:MAG: hypothetical protein CMP55_05905 [Flavobacteriales bacterium]|nr:hypothetical protein [Flavobacteriales bacterium]